MDVFEVLNQKMDFAIKGLQGLIGAFEQTENAEMIQSSGAVFDRVRSYLEIEDNLFYTKLRMKQPIPQEMTYIKQLQADIEGLLESSVMMHVDEPSLEFKSNLECLLDTLLDYRKYDQEKIFPIAKQTLSDPELREIESYLSDQTTHETPLNPELQTMMNR